MLSRCVTLCARRSPLISRLLPHTAWWREPLSVGPTRMLAKKGGKAAKGKGKGKAADADDQESDVEEVDIDALSKLMQKSLDFM